MAPQVARRSIHVSVEYDGFDRSRPFSARTCVLSCCGIKMFLLTESGELLQVINVFGTAVGQLVSLEISKTDNRHLNSIEVG